MRRLERDAACAAFRNRLPMSTCTTARLAAFRIQTLTNVFVKNVIIFINDSGTLGCVAWTRQENQAIDGLDEGVWNHTIGDLGAKG